MSYRVLLKSLFVVHPGHSPRAWKNRLKLLLLIARNREGVERMLARLSAALGEGGRATLEMNGLGAVHWPYVSRRWDAPERLEALASHYEVVTQQCPQLLLLGRDASLLLGDLSAYSAGCSLVLDRAWWFVREGELVLNLFQGELRVASLAFSLRQVGDELCVFVGSVQGLNKTVDSERSLAIYRDLTKDFEGLRPRSLLIEVLKWIARSVGATRIYAVRDGDRHHRHPYFGADTERELAADYDAIWLEHEATPSDREDFFSLPMAASRKAAEDIPAKKRAMYRRRYELLERILAGAEAALSRGEEQRRQRLLRLHRERLGELVARGAETAAAPRAGRLSTPLRYLKTLQGGVRRLRSHIDEAGWRATLDKLYRELRERGPGLLWNHHQRGPAPLELAAPSVPASALFAGEVVLVGDLGMPGYQRERVRQRQRALEALGYRCRLLDWREPQECWSALQTCSVVIFHRLPARPELGLLLGQARRLGVSACWEADELIFDAREYRESAELDGLDEDSARRILAAPEAYRQALLACDRAIAATPELAAAMREAGAKDVVVIEDSLEAAPAEGRQSDEDDATPRILYDLGGRLHDQDFRVAAQAILNVMQARPQVRLRIIGDLVLPEAFDTLAERVERLAAGERADYPGALAVCDVAVLPLAATRFNEAASHPEFLRASLAGLPSVCSPRGTPRRLIVAGDNGFLADDEAGWERALLELLDDRQLREAFGLRIRSTVLEHCSPQRMEQQLRQVVPALPSRQRKRVLTVNAYYAPRRIGGATVVAGQMARLVAADSRFEQLVFTSLPLSTALPYSLIRYEVDGVAVIGMGLAETLGTRIDFENPATGPLFEAVLASVAPDIVHLHSVQGLGAQVAESCRKAGIPFIVTLHDAWWVCGRYFMIDTRGNYCGQTTVRSEVCAKCVPDPALNDYRQQLLAGHLKKATALLAPSEFARGLYIANGFDPGKIRVNKNGVLPPAPGYRKRPGEAIRFGYVGGPFPMKGSELIARVFSSLERSDYELCIAGGSPFGPASNGREIAGKLNVSPGYDPSNIDDFFAGLDVLLCPTQCKETFGLAVREALVRDIWIISTDAGGPVDDIVEGVNGNIIPLSGDAQYLRQAVIAILDDAERFRRHRNPFKDKLTLFGDQALELQGIYAEIIEQAPSSAVAAVRLIPSIDGLEPGDGYRARS